MKTLFLILLSTATYSQTLNVGVGATTNAHGNFNLGFDIDIANVVRITPELISMVPHQKLSTFFGGRAGVIINRLAVQAGYYYSYASADKTEYTKNKNYWTAGGFISYDVYICDEGSLAVQAGYLKEPQALLTLKLNLSR